MSRSESPPNREPALQERTAHERPKLWVELAIDVEPTRECPLGTATERELDGTLQLVGSTCHLSVRKATDGEALRTFTTQRSGECFCPDVCSTGFTPVEMAIESGTLVVRAYCRDREALVDATSRLDGRVRRWDLRRVSTTSDGEEKTDSSAAAPGNLTEKQREAVRTAVNMGYYDRPREASLGDLADRLGVTRSALSQRLNAVESKLVADLSRRL